MKIFETVPVRVVSSRAIRHPGKVQYKIASRRNLLRRFECFIESTPWDEKYLCSKRIEKTCIGILFISIFFFLYVLVSLFLS